MITHRTILHVPGEEKPKQYFVPGLAEARRIAETVLKSHRNHKDAADLVAVIEEVKWDLVEQVPMPEPKCDPELS